MNPPPVVRSDSESSPPKTSVLAVFSLVLGLLVCPALAGLACGIVARVRIARSNGRLKGGRWALAGIVVSAFMLVLSFVAVGVLPSLVMKESMRRMTNPDNRASLFRLSQATRFYQNDNGGKFPPAANWCETVRPNLGARADQVLRGKATNSACGFGYNAAVAGLTPTDLNPITVVFFELASPDCNVAGDAELLRHPRDLHDHVAVLLVNGQVRSLSEAELPALRWKP